MPAKGQGPDEVGLEAARKQKIRNLQLKTVCLENEEYIQELHVTEHNENQKMKLDVAHEKAWKLIGNVEQGTKWNLTQAYDLPKLLRVCGLNLNPKDLYQVTDQPQFMDVVALRKTMQELKQHRNKNKIVSFGEMIDKAIKALDDAEQQLRRSQLDVTDIAAVPAESMKAIEDCMNVNGPTMAIASADERIKQQLKLIDRANEVQNIALADGEMAVAEEQYYTKISLLEMLLELINGKFKILDDTREENKPFGKVEMVKHKADQETTKMKEDKRKLKARCEGDLERLNEALNKADLQDAESMKRFSEFREASDRMVTENTKKQEQCWRQIQDLERQLQKLGTERFEEVKRRLEEVDREEKRKVEYQQFLEVLANHKRNLELTLFNCDVALNTVDVMDGLITDGVRLIIERHGTTNNDLEGMRLDIYKEQMEAFRQLYMTLGQLKYKKEKKLEEVDRQIRTTHIQLEFCIETFDPNAKKHSNSKKELYTMRAMTEEELEMIKEKMERLTDKFKPTEEALTAAGIEFLHPSQELDETNLHRRSKMVEYRVNLSQDEESKIQIERDEIKRQYQARSPSAAITNEPAQPQLPGAPDGPPPPRQGFV